MSSAARNMETTAPVRMAWTSRRERARRGSPAPILLTGALSSADIALLLASPPPEPTPGYGMEALRIFHGWPMAHGSPPAGAPAQQHDPQANGRHQTINQDEAPRRRSGWPDGRDGPVRPDPGPHRQQHQRQQDSERQAEEKDRRSDE